MDFRKNKSTDMALVNSKVKIITNIEDKKHTIGIFINFCKAFNSIKYEITFTKLGMYGLRRKALELCVVI